LKERENTPGSATKLTVLAFQRTTAGLSLRRQTKAADILWQAGEVKLSSK